MSARWSGTSTPAEDTGQHAIPPKPEWDPDATMIRPKRSLGVDHGPNLNGKRMWCRFYLPALTAPADPRKAWATAH